jgi:hypothetical protein
VPVAFVGVIFEVAHIGNVAYVPDFVSEELQVSGHHIEAQERPDVPKMHVIVDCRAANIHSDPARMDGLKFFLFSAQRVSQLDGIFLK